MASAPVFAVTPRVGAGLIPGTLDTSRTAPTNVTTLLTGVATGTKIERIILQSVGTTVAGLVCVFLYDNTTYHLFDEFLITAKTLSQTAVGLRSERAYTDLILPSTSWSLRVTGTIAGNVSLIKVTALGADL